MSGRGRGIALTRPAWMEEPRGGAAPSQPSQPLKPSGPVSDWARATSADGRPYWYSLSTGATTWEDPTPAAPAPRPNAWREVAGEDGRTYYYNEETKETQWQRPHGFSGPPQTSGSAPSGKTNSKRPEAVRSALPNPERVLPDGWAESRTADGRVYFYHAATRETRWTFPTEEAVGGTAGKEDAARGVKRSAEVIESSRDIAGGAGATLRGGTAIGIEGEGAHWKEHRTAEGKVYYYNTLTRETSWARPGSDSSGPSAKESDLKRPRRAGQVTDLRQLMSGSNALKSGKKDTPKAQHVVRRPRAPDGKALTDHQSETYFLKRAKIRNQADQAEASGKEDSAPDNFNQENRELLFSELLKEKSITSNMSWLETISRCAGDRRYTLLQSYGHRKHAWLKFVQKSAKEQRRNSIIASRAKSDSFLALMGEAFVKEPYKASSLDRCRPEAVKRFESDPRFRAVDDRTRAGLIKSFFGIRTRKGEREKAQKRKECLSNMKIALDKMVDPALRAVAGREGTPSKQETTSKSIGEGNSNGETVSMADSQPGGKKYFTDRTAFRELERFLLAVPGSKFVDNADLTDIIRDWRVSVERLAHEKRAREREARKALQRERRNAFRNGVEKMLLDGRLAVTARWKDVADVVGKEDFALPEAEMDGRPSDLFEDALERFEDRVQRYRDEFKHLLKEAGVDVQDSTTIDELERSEKLQKFIGAIERPVIAALLVDRQRRENKRRQKELQRASKDFEELLARAELPVGVTFEGMVEQLKDRSAYKQLQALGGEEHVKKRFDGFMDWLRSKEQSRQKRKLESHSSIPYDHAALAALERAKRVRLPGGPVPAPSFIGTPVPPVPPRVEEENGWAAALSAKPMTEKEKLEEKERRKRELLGGSGAEVLVNEKSRSKATE